MIHIYTGEGKGKTTAAVGLALRAKSRGLRVLFVQVMKTTAEGGETELMEALSIKVKRYRDVPSPLFSPEIDRDRVAIRVRQILGELLSDAHNYDMVVIDEFNNLLNSGMLEEEEAIRFIKQFPGQTELVLTGRGATDRMIEVADYVTYMKAIKHPHQKGLKAREGIEY